MVTMVTKDMHPSVNTKYYTPLRGPGNGYGYDYNTQGYRCGVMVYLTTLPGGAPNQAPAGDLEVRWQQG